MGPRRSIAMHMSLMALSLAVGLAAWAGVSAVGGGGPAHAASLEVDRIVVLKSARRINLLYRGHVVRTYSIALGFAPKGHKTTEGDGRTPEGLYRIDARNPKSSFTLSLRISYPNAADRAQARRRGVSPGGQIFIHGQPNRLGAAARVLALPGDWTLGCVAVPNRAIREMWRAVKIGTPIELRA